MIVSNERPSGGSPSTDEGEDGAGRSRVTGSFRLLFADQRWEWSPELSPCTTIPTIRVHDLIVVGDRVLGEGGAVIGAQGYYVDVTPSSDRMMQRSMTAALAEITEKRGAIEQAKGMLMLVYRISAEAAFDLLKRCSQASNVEVRAISEQIVADFLGLPTPTCCRPGRATTTCC